MTTAQFRAFEKAVRESKGCICGLGPKWLDKLKEQAVAQEIDPEFVVLAFGSFTEGWAAVCDYKLGGGRYNLPCASLDVFLDAFSRITR